MDGIDAFRRRMKIVLATAALALAQSAGASWPQPALVSVDAYDRTDGSALMIYVKDGKRYIVGTPGHEYAVRIRNCTPERILAVTSVDGVNVVTGETASPDQSGYVIEPYGSVEILGWRKSLERTAAFYFTDLRDSYAARTGRPGNVGVIGVAVFKKKQPPIVYRPQREKIAADSAARAEAPAPSANAESAPAQAYERDEAKRAAGAVAKQLGTGHGRSESSYAERVDFERATSYAAETVAIQYDRRENLIAMGVLPSSRYAQRSPDPFPGRFVPDPR